MASRRSIRFAAWAGALLWASLVAFVVGGFYRMPVVDGGLDHWSSFVAGAGILAPPQGPDPLRLSIGRVVICVAPLALGAVVAIAARVQRRAGPSPGAAVAAGAIGVALMAVILAIPRLSLPSPHHYLATLERVSGPVEQDRPFRVGTTDYRIEGVAHSPLRSPFHRTTYDGAPTEFGCVLVGPRGALPLGVPYGEDRCPPVLLRVDPRADIAILYSSCPDMCGYLPSIFKYLDDSPDSEIAEFAGTLGRQRVPLALAFGTADGAQLVLTPDRIADRISPPRSSVIVAVLGAAVAVAFVLLARSLRRRRADGTSERADALEASAFAVALLMTTPLVVAHALGF